MVDIKALLDRLTLEEKAALCSGVSSWQTTPIKRLNIPSVFMADGPHGVRKEIADKTVDNISGKSTPSTCFPPAVTLASSWNRELLYEVGEALANEAKSQGVSTLLGPGINIKRSPLCGRIFEYFSEDPYLTSELAIAYVKGVQDNGVGVSLKHFAANSQEFMRMNASSEIDERTLREIYLRAFENTVKEAKPNTIMCSYNPVNGVHASQNKKLLKNILKDEWGFKGIVISDWGAVDDRVKGIEAGLHLEMPSSNGIRDKWIVEAVEKGELSINRLDEIVYELLEFIFNCYENQEKHKGFIADYDKNHEIAKKAASEGSVLLKNENSILPINDFTSLGVIGALAKHLRSQGTGSSKLEPKKEVSFLQALEKEGINFTYSAAYDVNTDETNEAWLKDAEEVAKNSKTVLLFIGLTDSYESEGFDRDTIDIPLSHHLLINRVCKNNDNVIVVLTGGSPSEISYINQVKAILNVYLTGEAGGEAVLDILKGKINPSGKLAETFPLAINDVLANKYFAKEVAEYRESIFVGYRYFDAAKKDVLFPFGYGLSYTSFEYSNLRLSSTKINEKDTLVVKYDITNVGKLVGKEISELYIKDKESTLFVAEKELRAFEKTELNPGETRTISHTLRSNDFSFYNTNSKEWEVESGEFEILIGASSRDIKLNETIFVEGSAKNIPNYKDKAPSYFNLNEINEIPIQDFENLLGRPVHKYTLPGKGEYNFNTCVIEFNATAFSRWFKKITKRNSTILLPKDSTPAEKKMVINGAMAFPIRNLFAMSGGLISYKSAEGLLMMFNGKFWRGFFKLVGGFLAKKQKKKEEIFSQ